MNELRFKCNEMATSISNSYTTEKGINKNDPMISVAVNETAKYLEELISLYSSKADNLVFSLAEITPNGCVIDYAQVFNRDYMNSYLTMCATHYYIEKFSEVSKE